MSAREAWKQRVAAHREQSHKVRSALGVSGQDRWEPFSSFFKADPRRTDDVEVNRQDADAEREIGPFWSLSGATESYISEGV
jgi:hypothetical protein